MKRIYNYIMLLVVAFSYASCTNDDIDALSIEAKTGEEVQFGLSLDNATRTVYGPEENNAFPIYWVNGDKVQIYSPECSEGRNDAEYSVKPVAGKSYAESLTKTGSYGVQWGNNTTANFYSVYPSLNAVFSGTGDNVTAKLHISNEQKSNQSGATSADMDNVIMYAQTNGAEAGKTVNLKYIPYSTVFEFTANLGQSNNGYGKVKIVSLTLTAPTGTAIAGDFNLKFNGNNPPQITAAGNNSNVITLVPETQPLLNEANKTAKINLAMIPLSDVNKLEDGWTVTINVLEGDETTTKAYTKKLNGNYALAPGKIHKISLPKITPAAAWTYNLSNWIPSLYQYQQIYLTELSLPGAWYAGAPIGDGYQATDNIVDLWDKGIRAFAVETKCVTPMQSIRPRSAPVDVVVSGTADNAKLWDSEPGTNTLNTGGGNKYIYKQGGENVTLKTIFTDIINCLKEQENSTDKKPEFAVLVLSYADGGTTGNRPVDFGAWLELLYNSYNSLTEDYKKYIYSNQITATTTIGSVLNKLIVKINVDANIAQGGYVYQKGLTFTDDRAYSYGNNLPALFSYNPFLSQIGSGYYDTPVFSKMSWKNWTDAQDPYRSYATTTTTTDFLWCFSSANRTKVNTGTDATIPSYAQRQNALRTMISHSRSIWEKGSHNVWFYFNAGGTETTSQSSSTTSATNFAKTMNSWLLDVITLKSNGGVDTNGSYTGTIGTIVESDPSPLGIVMFNQCTGANDTYKGADIIKAIVDMNDKFTLKRAPVLTMTDYDGAVNNGGNAITTK